jgi:DNA-binding NtrC family response regulator
MLYFKKLSYLRLFFTESLSTVPLLADHFLDIFKPEKGLQYLTVSEKALERMLEYEWPGNVRELRNALERAVKIGNGQESLPEDLPISTLKSHLGTEEE